MYDFQAAVNAAKAVVEKAEGGGSSREYNYPLVYPQAGHNLTVRPLFNPKSGLILRLVQRHEKVPCYRTYGIECPICKIMQQVKDMTGQDPFGRSKASRSRGVCFAQYINSSNVIDKGNNKGSIKPGDIILLMFPWSVYTQISSNIQTISQTPTGMDQAFCHADRGMFINISATNDFKYTVTMNPYLTFNSGKSDDEFMKMLDEMEDLNEQVVPGKITQETDKMVNEYCSEIYKQFIEPRTPNAAPQNNPPQSLGQVSQNQTYQTNTQPTPPPAPSYQQTNMTYQPSQPTPVVSTGTPACFGQHKENYPQCIVCPGEMECIQRTTLGR